MPNCKRISPFLGAVITLSLPHAALSQRAAVDTLQWLSGCWRLNVPAVTVEEQWMPPSGGIMLGVSRTVRGGVAREHEFLRIYSSGDTLVYAAMPSGQQPTEFRSRSISPTEVVFENPAHDFPQRIRYRRSSDLLIATIEGDRDGKRQPSVVTYRRATCGTPAAANTAASPAARESAAATLATVQAALQQKYDTLVARETGYVGAMNSWFADHADTSFAHVMWTASGTTVPVGSRDNLANAGERMRTANTAASLRNRKFTLAIQRILLRGDTADVLVASSYVWVFADTAGRYGDRGADHERAGTERRIDRWVRAGHEWRLRQVSIIGVEVSIDGRLVAKDGATNPPR